MPVFSPCGAKDPSLKEERKDLRSDPPLPKSDLPEFSEATEKQEFPRVNPVFPVEQAISHPVLVLGIIIFLEWFYECFFAFSLQAQGYSLPDLSQSTPGEILDYIRRHYVLIKTNEGYVLGRNTRKRAR